MKYSSAELLADYGFCFLEKLHSPIFLLNKSGGLKKMNEAGRKLLNVLKVPQRQMEEFGAKLVASTLAQATHVEHQHVATSGKKIHLISKQLGQSDYILVEVVR